MHSRWLRYPISRLQIVRYKSSTRVCPLLPFRREDWLVDAKSIKHPPQAGGQCDRRSVHLKLAELAKNNIDAKFQSTLERAIRGLQGQALRSETPAEQPMRKEAWARLQDELVQQLQSYRPQESYRMTVADVLQPKHISTLLPQLLHVDGLTQQQWEGILEVPEAQKVMKLRHILDTHFKLLYHEEVLPKRVGSLSFSKRTLDISNPAEWFPEARKLRRTIVVHLGPTNSGKTYHALEKLKKCDRGYYAGPLRLLAREIYDRFQKDNIRCNLLTGEEVINDLDTLGNRAGLTSGTVEMVPLNQYFDMVVLDEIQMLADEQRGWAWTNALLGVQASELHLCGEPSVLPFIQRLVAMTGDKLVINEYQRLGKLEVESKPLPERFHGLKKGDCLVSFSKRKTLDLKLQIERAKKCKVAVIYGSLPPETRVHQATMFNRGEADILVASDAIGMGLNLSIKRVIFTSAMKWNGAELIPLTDSQTKQIAGRAGRYKVAGESDDAAGGSVGKVTALDMETLEMIQNSMKAPVKYIPSAVLWPPDRILAQILTKYPPGMKITTLLEHFDRDIKSNPDSLFILPNIESRIEVMNLIEGMDGLSLEDMMTLSNAPLRDLPIPKKAFINFCETVAKKETRSIFDFKIPLNFLNAKAVTDEDLKLDLYEELHHVLTLYMWLQIRYPDYFVDLESVKSLKHHCEYIIFEKLKFLKRNPYKKS
ncbi:AGL240Wp [Eremothecium gossypii ATCC 10895]|uniref:ATP-dependent RNA helicase SUV3, mitochondrial n=1 Tax=Eremothecium gossypii (strain ATCC 10895 / CBS 109.51 / FGSC 9923 / NRRL Y-1056) TaxID=284811 RepID=Q751E6_EREGS|nr:AGL240Wp [Eremothecium gossypii ATCC 10895]AAS54251.1 AGL240Wp [Eremothecium gossypii ATCC 10895]AEY98577.1 FAGL240Wp [Eremothecium gossypii FDAG1]